MEYLIVCLVSVFVAGFTFFSGFGLGTLLMPANFIPLGVFFQVFWVVCLAIMLMLLGLAMA